MEASQVTIDIWNIVIQELTNVFQAGTINLFVIILICFLSQGIKMSVYFLSKRMIITNILLAIPFTVFYFIFSNIEILELPVLYACYATIPVFFYRPLKKILPGIFKTNYHFLKKKEEEISERKKAKEKKKKDENK